MNKAQQLAEKLKQYIPNGDGYNSEFAKDLAEAIEYLSQDEQEPVAWLITHGDYQLMRLNEHMRLGFQQIYY